MGLVKASSEELTKREDLRAFLELDPALAVYFIGDLGERYFSRCRWWAHRRTDGVVDALVLLYNHPVYPTILTLGEKEGVARIVEERGDLWPMRFHTHLLPEHEDVFGRHHTLSERKVYLRMALHKADACKCEKMGDVKHLDAGDVNAIIDLLQDYPDGFFSPEDLESGYYFGTYRDGALAAMAGVHVVSPEYKVAAVGNVVTKPAFRGQGLATRCTAHLLSELFDAVDVVGLNVHEDNAPAISVYERLGFRCHSNVVLAYSERINVGI